jgi:ABC-2 type transport system permease protein
MTTHATSTSSDRGTWRLVARRDFWVRLRERSFLVSTLLNVIVISILVLARAFGGGGDAPSFDLGVVGDPATANAAAALGGRAGLAITVVPLPDEATIEPALRDGTVDAVLTPDRMVGLSGIDENLIELVVAAERNQRVTDLLDRYEVPQEARDAANEETPPTLVVIEPGDPNRSTNAAIAFVGVLILYGQLFGYGIWVASGVIEEKASRVVEMLLSAIGTRQLLAGKIVGIGTLGLAQLVVIATFAIGLALGTGAIDVPGTAIGAAGLDVGWFILGFAFYASVFAAAGSLVTRMEELQNVIVPINLTILVSFFISVDALQHPDGLVVRIASILPTSSALAMPVRIVLGAAEPWEIALSLALIVGGTIVLVPMAARLYRGAVLRTGARVKIREAWRAAARPI